MGNSTEIRKVVDYLQAFPWELLGERRLRMVYRTVHRHQLQVVAAQDERRLNDVRGQNYLDVTPEEFAEQLRQAYILRDERGLAELIVHSYLYGEKDPREKILKNILFDLFKVNQPDFWWVVRIIYQYGGDLLIADILTDLEGELSLPQYN